MVNLGHVLVMFYNKRRNKYKNVAKGLKNIINKTNYLFLNKRKEMNQKQ